MANPQAVQGTWVLGWTLDAHTVSSEFLGYDANGHAQFNTVRSELGELMYQLKYRGRLDAADALAAAMAEFLKNKPVLLSRVGLVATVPPSNTGRAVQPVFEVAKRLADRLGKVASDGLIRKVKETPALKDVFDAEQRRELLHGAFEADASRVRGAGVLLIDDLYRSGSTANAVAHSLISAGAARVYFLAATRTRSGA